MQWANEDPVCEHAPAVEFDCTRCGSASPRGGTCEACLEVLGEFRALAGEYASRMGQRALPWHPSWASGASS